ncbi:bacteriocin immunity protein [Vibrio campbellii]|uniref:bacteriocin immunity protein n=1 Tax=Vibrio campbellii TaxID=680 RepID=UPI00249CEB51|nr:bacteriocin immunity protein [Vibrio campbellii]
MKKKKSISDYTEREFLHFTKDIYECNGSEEEIEQWVNDFIELVAHPESSDLIFYPPDDREDSPEAVIEELKRWYKEQGKPCFKDSM